MFASALGGKDEMNGREKNDNQFKIESCVTLHFSAPKHILGWFVLKFWIFNMLILQNLWMAWILSMKFEDNLYETGICYLLTILKNVSEKKLQQVEFLQRKQRVALLQQT